MFSIWIGSIYFFLAFFRQGEQVFLAGVASASTTIPEYAEEDYDLCVGDGLPQWFTSIGSQRQWISQIVQELDPSLQLQIHPTPTCNLLFLSYGAFGVIGLLTLASLVLLAPIWCIWRKLRSRKQLGCAFVQA